MTLRVLIEWIARRFERHAPRPRAEIRWRGVLLEPGVYCGALRFADTFADVLEDELDVAPDEIAEVLVIDDDRVVDMNELAEVLEHAPMTVHTLAAPPGEVVERADALGLDAFDLVITVFETTTVTVDAAARGSLEAWLAGGEAAESPWLVIGVGDAGYRDRWLRALRMEVPSLSRPSRWARWNAEESG